MPNELVPASEAQNTVASIDEVTSSAGYLGRLQLMTANSAVCKSGEFAVNHFAYIMDKANKDLGTTVDILVCAWRGKALDTGSDEIVESLDPQSEVYKNIQRKADTANSGCMHGPEYLVWIPELSKFATLFYGSKSARRESKSIHALLRCGATLSAKKCETPKFTWFTCTADECEDPGVMPDQEELMTQIDNFINPPEPETPEVDDSEDTGRAQ